MYKLNATTSLKRSMFNTLFSKIIAILGLIMAFNFPLQALVYTSSNEAAGNRVIAFDINDRNGRILEIGSFPTQGTGTGAPLGNQSALITDASDRWLFVTNSGDGSVTSFRLQPNGLEFVSNIPSGGYSPISVTVFGTLVYVLNEGSGDQADPANLRYDTVTGLRFNNSGELEPIADSLRIIDDTQLTAPAQIGFNKSGTVLLVTEKATNTITTYVMQQDDTPAANPLKRPSFIPTPFGFEFGDRDYVFITEANGGAQGVTASYRVDRETGLVSGLVDAIDQGNATCWTVLTNDQTMGYSINTGSGTVSIYRINFNGTIEPFRVRGNHPDIQIQSGDAPRDAILTQNNRALVVLNNGGAEIRSFNLRSNGSLKPRNTLPIPASATGLVAR